MVKFHKTIKQAFSRNEDLEKNGVPVDFIVPGAEKITFYVARAGGSNDKYNLEFTKKIQGLQSVVSFDSLEPQQRRKLWQEVYADSIIVNWEGVKDEAGKPVAFTRENILSFFEEFPEIWEMLFLTARDWGNFKEKVASVVKN